MLPDPGMVQRVELLANPEDKYRLSPQDILITAKATPSNLRCAYLSEEWPNRWLFAANLIRVQVRPGIIHPIYLHAWFCHPEGRAALISASQSTTGQLNLTASAVSKIPIPVPPWQTQLKAVELLHAASLAHRHAIAAAESRLMLAREIAFLARESDAPAHSTKLSSLPDCPTSGATNAAP
jgi:hypothetical protein